MRWDRQTSFYTISFLPKCVNMGCGLVFFPFRVIYGASREREREGGVHTQLEGKILICLLHSSLSLSLSLSP